LLLFIFPLAIGSILAILFFPHYYILDTSNHPKELFHILISILAFSFLCIAALQAVFLAIQEYSFRHKQTGLMQVLPPLVTMETFLFQTIWIGFILLTIVLITSILFFDTVFTGYLFQKTLLTFISWVIFAILLFGRHIAGWRGKIAIRGTLLGFGVLILAYFSSRLLFMIFY
jgi:ABC-type uncharacterized transport system permease subunit